MLPISEKLFPALGFGLGLRKEHYEAVLAGRPALGWLEIVSENFLVGGGKPLDYLERIRAEFPLVMHGVSLSIGGTDPIDLSYLKQLKTLAHRIDPAWISDHLCWTGVQPVNLHDLMPLPYTAESLHHVAARIRQVQEYLGRRILLENVSSYLDYRASEMPEWEFLSALAEESDCLLLLDINNVYVSACNHAFDPYTYIEHLPLARVQQIHLAGHRDYGAYRIDTHDEPVIDPVWKLYAGAVKRFGEVSTMIERDDNIPPLEDLLAELTRAERIAAQALQAHDSSAGRDDSLGCPTHAELA
ncbi:MAG: MNIO family bufferin maturase [Gammaproteobacteria bacterium]